MSFRSGLIKVYGSLDAIAPRTLAQQPPPGDWSRTPFGPGAPITPMGTPYDNDQPREIDYPVLANATITPRSAYGLRPFAALLEAYELVDEVKTMVRILHSECSVFEPGLGDQNGDDVSHDTALERYVRSPDGQLPWDVWSNRMIASAAIYDAPCALMDLRNELLTYVDGSTIFCLIDENGHTPRPPEPAYAQVVHGIPWAWYAADRLWYKPQNRRVNAPYGQPGIEVGWTAIMMLAKIAAFEIAYYTEGNTPEAWALGNDDQTFEQLQEMQRTMNSRMGAGFAERRRLQFMAGVKSVTVSKRADFPTILYKQYHDNLAAAFGIPPSEFVIVEGLFVVYWPELRAMLDTKVYVQTDAVVCFNRRLARDVAERGRTPESVCEQYNRTVLPSAEWFVYPTMKYADLVVSGEEPLAASTGVVLNALDKALAAAGGK